MSHVVHQVRRSVRIRSIVAALLASIAIVSACGGGPVASFDPTGACTVDGRAPGGYPELEALVPTTYEGRGPDRLDSGRNCSPENLGVLADAGIDEVRFAGGLWDFGADRGATLAVFSADGLTAEMLGRFYEASATASNRTRVVTRSEPTIAGRKGFRIDTETGPRRQSVVVWRSTVEGRVNVVISSNIPEPKIEAAIAAFADR
ncbi:MAG: hypothetical protein H0V74_08195 [Chloroflexi bacterium]|nr:hypothetical protein [Chloroflexota bacterium]